MANENVKLRLEIDVVYCPNGMEKNTLEKTLLNAAEHLVDNGLLSGEIVADVVRCDARVVEIGMVNTNMEEHYGGR